MMALTAEQKAVRVNFLGGSDAPVVVGVCPFKSPIQLWLEKRGESVDEEETEAMFWGNRLEDEIVRVWSERTGNKIRRASTRWSRVHPFMAVNMDRQIIGHKRGPGYLEAKNFGQWTGGHIQSDDDVHDYVKIQCQHGLAVTEYEWAAYAILIGGQRLFCGEVERDETVIDFLIEAEAKFWQMVQEGVQPEMDGRERTAKFLKHLFPRDHGEALVVTDPHLMGLAKQLVDVKAKLKALEEEKEKLNNTFKLIMKDHQILKIPDWGGLEWKNNKDKPVEVFMEEEFKAAHPDLYKQFTKKYIKEGARVFTVHEGKDYDKPKKANKQKAAEALVAG
ncbi:MAG: YqaJ viral recombinase family protein [Nitrospirales bacterium]|nr:YqaJ viral recombinase family protein [Nitrospirales bacterium]